MELRVNKWKYWNEQLPREVQNMKESNTVFHLDIPVNEKSRQFSSEFSTQPQIKWNGKVEKVESRLKNMVE